MVQKEFSTFFFKFENCFSLYIASNYLTQVKFVKRGFSSYFTDLVTVISKCVNFIGRILKAEKDK